MPSISKTKPSAGSIGRLIRFASRYSRACLGVLVLQLLGVGFGVVGLDLLGRGIDRIHSVFEQQTPGSAVPAEALQTVFWLSGGILLAGLLTAAVRFSVTVAQTRLVQQVVIDLRSSVYDHIQRLHFGFFDRSDSTALINRVTADVQMVRIFIDGVLIQGLVLALSLATYLGYMLWTHALLTGIVLLPAPLLFRVTLKFSRKIRPAYLRSGELMDKLVRRVSESVQGIHVIKAFGRQKEAGEGFDRTNTHIRRQRSLIFDRVTRYTIAVLGLTYLSTLLLLGFGSYFLISGWITLGNLVIFFALSERLNTLVNNLATLSNNVQQALAGAHRVFEVLDNPIQVTSSPQAQPLAACRGRISFEGVNFGHNPDRPILKDISFTAEPGECLAIVGGTGSGKSTLLSLIPRFYDPQTGCLKIDDHDVRHWRLNDLRRQIGLVFQEPFLFSNSVAANIAYGHPQASEEQIRQAARIAQADEFIEQLPDGYQQVIGERGMTLSGGQRQRLAIARALLTDPAILLLDDPTAAVDSETEHQLMTAIDQALRGRTTILVTSRLSSLKRADRILVLDAGCVVQIGTHEKLLAETGPYRRLVNLQGDAAHPSDFGSEAVR